MRAVLIATAVVMATAAPLRAWCEASCLAPAHHAESSRSHCPTTEPSGDDGTSLSASSFDECPAIEAARTTNVLRSDLLRQVPSIPVVPDRSSRRDKRAASLEPLERLGTVLFVPLRI